MNFLVSNCTYMLDRYFIKSFLCTCLFTGSLLAIIFGLSILFVEAAYIFAGFILLFFWWFYRLDNRLSGLITAAFSLPVRLAKSFAVFLEKLGAARQ